VINFLSFVFLFIVAGPAMDKLFPKTPSDRDRASRPLPSTD
jgi:hypothetical protein